MAGKGTRNRAATTVCPHCQTKCWATHTRQMSDLVREVTYTCQNTACGHIFVASITAVRTLQASQMPRDGINIDRVQVRLPTQRELHTPVFTNR